MNGWLDEKGVWYPCGISKHYKYLTGVLKFSDSKANDTPNVWVAVRPWDCGQDVVEAFKYAAAKYEGGFSSTGRKRYTPAQLDWLQKHNVFIDKEKI